MRFGQILISALSHNGMKKEEVVNELFYMENKELKDMLDMFLDYYEREAFKRSEE
jgi:hypothetical protein